jgi:N-acetylneuraminate synthase
MTAMETFFSPSNPRCLVIAEVAQTHDGSLGQAHAFIDAAAGAGADAIKFQTHIASAESTPAEQFRIKFSRQDASRYDYWKRMEFTEAQWRGLADHAKESGLHFLSSPFSMEAVDLLERLNMAAWKIASGEIDNTPMLKRLAATGRPVILSTGLGNWQDIDRAVALVKNGTAPLGVLQTTSMYPTPAEHVGLNVLAELRQRYGCTVGLSDHSGTIFPGLAAYSLGGRLLEVHLTLSRQMFGPDVSSSLTVEELAQLVTGLRFLEKTHGHPVDKNAASEHVQNMRRLFGKSVVARRKMAAGTFISADDVTLKKPGGGVSPDKMEMLYGRKLLRAVEPDEAIGDNDVDPKLT